MLRSSQREIRTDAYHGTNLTSALNHKPLALVSLANILSKGFIPHLGIAGVGVYFDLEDDSSARQRALEKADGDPSQAVIIRVEVHLGKIIEINFRYNPVIASEFVRFQIELKKQFGVDIPFNFSQQKEIWKYSEQVYQLLVRRFAESGKVTANDLTKALAQKHIRYAMEA